MAVHVRPLNDEREHEPTAVCWCDPEVHWVDPNTGQAYPRGPIVQHHAADGRETSEEVTGESMAPDKTWETVEIG